MQLVSKTPLPDLPGELFAPFCYSLRYHMVCAHTAQWLSKPKMGAFAPESGRKSCERTNPLSSNLRIIL